jgi:hypothetical protein
MPYNGRGPDWRSVLAFTLILIGIVTVAYQLRKNEQIHPLELAAWFLLLLVPYFGPVAFWLITIVSAKLSDDARNAGEVPKGSEKSYKP